MLDYREKGFGVYLIFMFIFLIFNTIVFGLMLSAFIYYIKMKSYEENDTNIYVPGLKNFNFIKSNKSIEYTPDIPNLGYAGPLYLNCYEGICKEYKDHRNYDRDDDDIDDDFYTDFFSQYNFPYLNIKGFLYNNLSEFKSFIKDNNGDEYKEYALYKCSRECAIGEDHKCKSCPSTAVSIYGHCKYKTYDFYTSNKFCYASNIILRWEGLLFTRTNMSDYKTYSYATNAFSKSENCPLNYKMCGFLDEDMNKLCLPKEENCPINHIEYGPSPPTDEHNYENIILNNLTIYYSNKFENDGIIIDGLFVDSDYKKKYIKGCITITTGNLDDLMRDNYEKIYINENVNRNGKAYLKWCSPGHDRTNINLTEIRMIYKEYTNNVSINKYIINTKESADIVGSFIIGFIFLIALYIFVLGNLFGKYSQMRNSNCCFCFQKEKYTIIPYIIFFIFFGFSSMINFGYFLSYGDTLELIKKNITIYNINYDDVDISNLIRINKSLISFLFIFIPFIIAFFISYCVIKSNK